MGYVDISIDTATVNSYTLTQPIACSKEHFNATIPRLTGIDEDNLKWPLQPPIRTACMLYGRTYSL